MVIVIHDVLMNGCAAILMTDGLRIAHLGIAHWEAILAVIS